MRSIHDRILLLLLLLNNLLMIFINAALNAQYLLINVSITFDGSLLAQIDGHVKWRFFCINILLIKFIKKKWTFAAWRSFKIIEYYDDHFIDGESEECTSIFIDGHIEYLFNNTLFSARGVRLLLWACSVSQAAFRGGTSLNIRETTADSIDSRQYTVRYRQVRS